MPVTEGPSLLLQAIGATLPAAMAVALSPFPVIAVVLILGSPHGRRNGPLYALGWVAGLTVVATIVVFVFGEADDPDSTSSAIADWLRVLAGAALLGIGVRKWWQRPRDDEEVSPPRWMASLDEVTGTRALLLGAVMSGVNPKNFVLTASASASIVEAGVHDTELVIAVAVFVLLGSFAVIGACVAALVGGRRGAAVLDAVRDFMVEHNTAITVLVLMILGATVLGDGLAALGR